jgi:hypothetical protein
MRWRVWLLPVGIALTVLLSSTLPPKERRLETSAMAVRHRSGDEQGLDADDHVDGRGERHAT